MKYTILIIISVIGFILFFPFRFDDDQCCLGEVLSKVGWLHFHQHGTYEHVHGEQVDHHYLVQRYVFPFGLMWWLSIALGFWSIRQLMKNHLKGRHDQFAEHSTVV